MSTGRTVTLLSGHKMPQIGYGTWQAKPGEVGDGVYEALKTGYRHLDLAKIYQNQREVGEGIKRALVDVPGLRREDIFITSKLWNNKHNPEDVPALLALLDAGANIAIGARVAGEGAYTVRGPRRWAMKLLSAVISRIAHTRLTDTTSGFKACDARAIDLFAQTYPAEYLGDTVESLVVAARSRLLIREVGVHMRPRAGGAPSHNPVRSALFLGRAVMALALALTRPRPARPDERRYEGLGA